MKPLVKKYPDIVRIVTEIIKACDPMLGQRFVEQFSKYQLNVNDPLETINTFWRLELGMCEEDTVQERECLVDDIDHDVWINNFCIYVIPKIRSLQLPKAV